ncbi:MAG: SDR family NAD(P)-dependent oxidoreductase [Candidatus Kapaibacteriota bacterium]
MKTALVTGANKGVGLEIAKELCEKGFHVFLAARNPHLGSEASSYLVRQKYRCTFVPMDVSDSASIREAFRLVSSKIQHLDVLVNNAGILLDHSQSILQIPESVLLSSLQTNAVGALIVAQTFLPLMQHGSRIINVSSSGGQISRGASTFAPAYCISKTTMNAITLQLSSALAPQGIAVNAMCPGWVQTEMGGAGAQRTVQQGADTALWLATEAPPTLTGKFLQDRKEIVW